MLDQTGIIQKGKTHKEKTEKEFLAQPRIAQKRKTHKGKSQKGIWPLSESLRKERLGKKRLKVRFHIFATNLMTNSLAKLPW
jgi:hypothetical protein